MSEQVKELILWARQQRIQLGRVKLGDLELELVDLELLQPPPGQGELVSSVPDSPADMYAQMARERGLNISADDLRDRE